MDEFSVLFALKDSRQECDALRAQLERVRQWADMQERLRGMDDAQVHGLRDILDGTALPPELLEALNA